MSVGVGIVRMDDAHPVDVVVRTPVVIVPVVIVRIVRVIVRVIRDDDVRGIHHGKRCREMRAHGR